MEPTLNISDRVLVIKDKYINIEYQVGDVVVFYNPNYSYDKSTYQEFYNSLRVWNLNEQQLSIDTAFIKRVIGLEGDTITINNNGEIYNDGELIKIDNIYTNNHTKENVYSVPENSIFVLGDNRANSIDSRVYGFVSVDQIIGKAIYKIYPLNELGNIND